MRITVAPNVLTLPLRPPAVLARAAASLDLLSGGRLELGLDAYCAAYCRGLARHHTIQDQAMFPRLRAGDPRLVSVVDRLEYEHRIIHDVLERVDRAMLAFVGPAADSRALQQAVDELTDTLLSHLCYEERELVEPIARLGVLV